MRIRFVGIIDASHPRITALGWRLGVRSALR